MGHLLHIFNTTPTSGWYNSEVGLLELYDPADLLMSECRLASKPASPTARSSGLAGLSPAHSFRVSAADMYHVSDKFIFCVQTGSDDTRIKVYSRLLSGITTNTIINTQSNHHSGTSFPENFTENVGGSLLLQVPREWKFTRKSRVHMALHEIHEHAKTRTIQANSSK